MTAKTEYRKCAECYRAGIDRLIRGFQLPREFVPGVPNKLFSVSPTDLIRARDAQLKLWEQSSWAVTSRHRFHTSSN